MSIWQGEPKIKYVRRRKTIEDIFWRNTEKKGENECWNWLGGRGNGYGMFQFNKKLLRASKISYILHNKTEIPDGKQINHICDNPSCVNPKHLYIGTQKDNMRDMGLRGRIEPIKLKGKATRYIINYIKKHENYRLCQ